MLTLFYSDQNNLVILQKTSYPSGMKVFSVLFTLFAMNTSWGSPVTPECNTNGYAILSYPSVATRFEKGLSTDVTILGNRAKLCSIDTVKNATGTWFVLSFLDSKNQPSKLSITLNSKTHSRLIDYWNQQDSKSRSTMALDLTNCREVERSNQQYKNYFTGCILGDQYFGIFTGKRAQILEAFDFAQTQITTPLEFSMSADFVAEREEQLPVPIAQSLPLAFSVHNGDSLNIAVKKLNEKGYVQYPLIEAHPGQLIRGLIQSDRSDLSIFARYVVPGEAGQEYDLVSVSDSRHDITNFYSLNNSGSSVHDRCGNYIFARTLYKANGEGLYFNPIKSYTGKGIMDFRGLVLMPTQAKDLTKAEIKGFWLNEVLVETD